MLQSIFRQVTRWRVLVIALVAFAGLVTISSRKGDRSRDGAADPEVTIVEFKDSGALIGPERVKRVVHSDGEWRKLLSADQFYVTRKQSTDMPFSGTYYRMHEPGVFRCICCGTALFGSDAKFDSGTGWPSFWAPIAAENVRAHQDRSLFLERTEVVCTRCGAHLGHVFDDGPEPTHLRYCINESSLRFVAQAR